MRIIVSRCFDGCDALYHNGLLVCWSLVEARRVGRWAYGCERRGCFGSLGLSLSLSLSRSLTRDHGAGQATCSNATYSYQGTSIVDYIIPHTATKSLCIFQASTSSLVILQHRINSHTPEDAQSSPYSCQLLCITGTAYTLPFRRPISVPVSIAERWRAVWRLPCEPRNVAEVLRGRFRDSVGRGCGRDAAARGGEG